MEELQKLISDQTEKLLEKLGFENGGVKVEGAPHDPATYFVEITLGADQHFLIGQYGVNLVAFQHVLRLVCRKLSAERLNIVVDVNGYLKEKRQALEAEAAQALQEVEKADKPITLRPMLPYERKIIHQFFLAHPHVVTQSEGSGKERRILISRKA